MPDLKSWDNVQLALAFLVPGLIVLFVRSQFLTGRMPSHVDAALSYLALSVVYLAAILPIFEIILEQIMSRSVKVAAIFILFFVGPAFFGLALGLDARTGLTRRLIGKIGIRPIHGMPTAWDWKFNAMPEQWVIVTLKDDTKFYGYCGQLSFMSSDQKERDLYIESTFDFQEDGTWTPRNSGALIVGGEIRSIEFFPCIRDDGETNA